MPLRRQAILSGTGNPLGTKIQKGSRFVKASARWRGFSMPSSLFFILYFLFVILWA
jgi:uncharacterized membrane protein (DUF485 family)